MSRITKDDILKLAQLSKIDLTDSQVDKFRAEIEEIVNYVEKLQAADVSGLEPTDQVTGLVNVTRPDEIREYSDKEKLLKNVPNRDGDLIKVNRMVG